MARFIAIITTMINTIASQILGDAEGVEAFQILANYSCACEAEKG